MVANTLSCVNIGYYEVEINPISTNTCIPSDEPKYTKSWRAFLTVSGGTSTVIDNQLSDNYTNYIGQTTTISFPSKIQTQISGCILEPTSRTISITGSEPSCVIRTIEATKLEATGCTNQNVGTYIYSYSMTYYSAQTYSK